MLLLIAVVQGKHGAEEPWWDIDPSRSIASPVGLVAMVTGCGYVWKMIDPGESRGTGTQSPGGWHNKARRLHERHSFVYSRCRIQMGGNGCY